MQNSKVSTADEINGRDTRAQAGTIRLKLLKIGAVIVRNTRRVRFQLSSVCPDKALFTLVAARLDPG